MMRILLWLGLFSVNGAAQAEVPTFSQVEVVPRTTFGEPLGKVKVSLRSSSHEFSQVVVDNHNVRFRRIPFDSYEVVLEAANFAILRERIEVNQASMTFRFGLHLSVLHGARNEIQGTVAGINGNPGMSELWVRLVPVFSGQMIQGSVDRSGSFRFSNVFPGEYTLLLFHQNRLLLAKQVGYRGGTMPVNLDLLHP